VAQIARAIARQLGLDEDLTETLALAHDLGHPPFGHAGERALDECLAGWGGFDHNAQTLRVVTSLERRYPEFDGLNLTWEALEGIVKHNGPMTDQAAHAVGRYAVSGIPQGVADYTGGHDLELWSSAGLEAQVAGLADDIAYDAHDIDDGLRAGLFTVDELAAVPVLAEIITTIHRRYPGLDEARRGAELVRELISALISDVIAETTGRLAELRPTTVADIRESLRPTAAFSDGMTADEKAIKGFLRAHMYRHERVMRVMHDAGGILRDLFGHYVTNPDDLPPGWLDSADDEPVRHRKIGDFIAGMTDRFAIVEHQRIFDSTPVLR
jgi:dGTPase